MANRVESTLTVFGKSYGFAMYTEKTVDGSPVQEDFAIISYDSFYVSGRIGFDGHAVLNCRTVHTEFDIVLKDIGSHAGWTDDWAGIKAAMTDILGWKDEPTPVTVIT